MTIEAGSRCGGDLETGNWKLFGNWKLKIGNYTTITFITFPLKVVNPKS